MPVDSAKHFLEDGLSHPGSSTRISKMVLRVNQAIEMVGMEFQGLRNMLFLEGLREKEGEV